MKLSDIKKKIAEVSPFLKLEFFGVDNCLAVGTPPVPLTVCLTPPSVSFIIESGTVTTLLLRYSSTYKRQIEKMKAGETDLPVAQKALQEIADKVLSTPEEQAQQLAIVSKLGREYLIAKALYGYYQGPNQTEIEALKDKFNIVFSDDKELVDSMNASSGDGELAVLVDALDDMELFRVGMSLMSAMPHDHPMANIPFVDTETNAKGEVKEEVVATAPAEKVTRFPRDLRGISVEDVPPSSGEESGDSFN